MTTPHPYLTLDEMERQNSIRKFFNIPEDQPVPPTLIAAIEDRAHINLDPTTRKMQVEYLATKLHRVGVPLKDNMMHQINVNQTAFQWMEERNAQRESDRGWGDAITDAFVNVGLGIERAGISYAKSMLEKSQHESEQMLLFGHAPPSMMDGRRQYTTGSATVREQLFAKIYSDLSPDELEELGNPTLEKFLSGEMSIKQMRKVLREKAWKPQLEVFEEADFFVRNQLAQRARLREGKASWGLHAWRWGWEVTAGITEFVVAAKIAGPVGIQAVIVGHAKVIGDDVYRETGDGAQALFATVAHIIATNAIFKYAGGGATKLSKQLDDMWGQLAKSGNLKEGLSLLSSGETAGFTKWLVQALKIEGIVIATRDVEWLANVAFDQFSKPEIQAQQFKMTSENFWAVTGHAATEGAIFIGMPTGTKTMGGVFGHASRRLGFEQESFRGSLLNTMRNIVEIPEKDTDILEGYVKALDAIDTTNQPFNVVRQGVRNMLLKSKGEEVAEPLTYDTAKGAKGTSAKANELMEAAEMLNTVFGRGESAKPPRAEPTADGKHTLPKTELAGSPEAKNRRERESEEFLAKKSRKRGEEDIPEPVDEGGKAKVEALEAGEKSPAEVAREAIKDPKKLDVIEKRHAELTDKKEKTGRLSQSERVELERLDFAKRMHGLYVETTGGVTLAGEALTKSIEHWDELRKDTDTREIRHSIFTSARELFKSLKKVLELPKDLFPTKAELQGKWDEYVAGVKKAFADAGIESDPVITKLENLGMKPDGTGKILGKASYEKALKDAEKAIEKESNNDAQKRIGAGLTHRKMDQPFTGLTPILDNILIAIKKVIHPGEMIVEGTTYEAPTLTEAFLGYKKILAKRRVADEIPAELETALERIKRNIEKAEGGKYKDLTVEEMTEIASFIENLHLQHREGRDIDLAQRQAEYDLLTEQIIEELNNTFGFDKEMSVATRIKGESGAETLLGILKAVGHGIHMNGRLTDAVEFMSGGTETTAFRVLARNLQQGLADAYKANSQLQIGLTKHFKSKGITAAELHEVSDANAKNHPHNKKHFRPAATVEAYGRTHHISSGNVVGLFVQMKDASTRSLWYEGNAGLNFRGESHPIRGDKQGKIIDEILNPLRGGKEERIANAIVEYLNQPEIKGMVRDIGMRMYGIDIIVKSGNLWVYRRRQVIKSSPVIREREPGDLFDISREEAGFDIEYSLSVEKGAAKPRKGGAEYDILVGDGQLTMNRWMKIISNLEHLEPHVTLAQRLLRGNLSEYKTEGRIRGGKAGIAAQLLGSLNKHFYEPAIRVEQAMYKEHGPIDKGIMMLRNNLVHAGLAYNPAIPLYQPLSMIAAGVHWGDGAPSAIWRAIGEYLTGGKDYRENLRTRGIENSGLLWSRLVGGGNASALVTGESMQARQPTVVLGGEKHKSTAMKGTWKGRWARFQDIGMKGIEGFDHAAVVVLYRAAELHVEKNWKSRGKSIKENKELYEEVVRREYEDMLIETQPSFHPFHQPAIINSVADNPFRGLYTMFKGYTGKLTSIQRRAFMRAARATAQGNHMEAAAHLAYGARMTVVGSAMIPWIRNSVKMGIAAGGAEALEMMGLTEEEHASLGDYGLSVAERSWLDSISQNIGMTGLGDTFDHYLMRFAFPDRRYTEGPMGPFSQTLAQFHRSMDSLFYTNSEAPTVTEFKRWLSLLRSGGSFVGIPGVFGNAGNSIIRQTEINRLNHWKTRPRGRILQDTK